jgi:FkbH-like protein
LDALERLRRKYTNLYLINLDDHLGVVGFNNAFDTRNWYFSHCRLSLTGLKNLTSVLDDLLDRFINPRKKVLVLDCDNTLWDGVVGEDEVAGIRLGSDGLGMAFSDFQNVIKEIAGTGILLAICSKNNEADVWEVFDKNPNMKIAKNEIVAYRINWSDKHINLIEMADELGLSLDSFVFWDDNPLERALVKSELPMVEVIDVPEDVMRWPSMLRTLNSLRAYEVTSEDRSKLNQYKARANFSRNMEVGGSKIDFLKSIRMKAQLVDLTPHFLERAHQLVSKTNQFNLRGVRYTLSDLELSMSDPKSILQLGSLEDSFGDHGIVSFLIGKVVSKDVVFIDTFVMSCRVLGRHFEHWMLYSLVNKLNLRGFKYVIAEYIPSQRNQVCQYLVKDSPFVPINDNFMEFTFPDQIVFANKSDRGLLNVQSVKFPLIEVFNNA